MGRKLTNEEFIEKAKKVHGDKYDYSLVDYQGSLKNVTIICKEHGAFTQKARKHSEGQGCRECGIIKYSSGNIKDEEYFINKVREVHGDRYDYSKTKYIGSKYKVTIICPIHGEFEQIASTHLKGRGCYECNGCKKKTDEQFIEESKKIHENKYDYSLVEYNGALNKIIIICPEHGEFDQVANSHLNGAGCPVCKSSKGEKLLNKLLSDYNYEEQYKLVKNPKTNYYLKSDFYLHDYNFIIEYDGRQHFEEVFLFGGRDNLKYTQFRDNIKNKYCKDNKINLLRIHYTSTEEEIEKTIAECVKDIKDNKFVYKFLNYPQ